MANNVMNTDGGIPPFRFWCQHVLPLVYDDSLSYMELLCKVINYLNEMSEKIKSIDPYMSELTQEFIALKEYVDNFVDNLDIESAVDQKIEELIASGDFTDLVSPTMYTGNQSFGMVIHGVQLLTMLLMNLMICLVSSAQSQTAVLVVQLLLDLMQQISLIFRQILVFRELQLLKT